MDLPTNIILLASLTPVTPYLPAPHALLVTLMMLLLLFGLASAR